MTAYSIMNSSERVGKVAVNKVQMLLATRRGYDYWLKVNGGEPEFLGNTDMKYYAETGADIEISDEDLATLRTHLEQ